MLRLLTSVILGLVAITFSSGISLLILCHEHLLALPLALFCLLLVYAAASVATSQHRQAIIGPIISIMALIQIPISLGIRPYTHQISNAFFYSLITFNTLLVLLGLIIPTVNFSSGSIQDS